MGKIFHHGNWKKEKGLTLLEVVIALTVIVIVSISVFSISIYSSNALNIANIKNFFVIESSNFANYFLSYDATDFSDALVYTTNLESYDSYANFTLYYDSNYSYVEEENAVYHLDFVFTDENSVLTLNAYNKDNSTIYIRSVTK